MADKNNHSDGKQTTRQGSKPNVTGSYPGVTGTYKPHSAYPSSNTAAGAKKTQSAGTRQQKPINERSEAVRNGTDSAAKDKAPDAQKRGFDFKLWFSRENNRAFLKQLRYYGLIVLAALILTFGIITVSNDVFAFIKPDESIIVTIEQGGGTPAIAKALKKAGVIEHPLIFRLYSKLKKADGKYQYGDYTLNSNLAYDQIIAALKKPSVQAESYKVTIPEGATQDEIAELLISQKRVAAAELEHALNEYEYEDFEFISDLPDRRCRLEGYLPAGEYEFYVGESAVSIVEKMLTRFEETVLTEENKAKIEQSGMSLDDIVTLSSLVFAECSDEGAFKGVSRVLLNRLADENGLLQLTRTINYVLAAEKTEFTADDKKTDSEYNTYIYAGLPPGPVCNPSLAAINAVLAPEEGSNKYFVSDSDKTYFAATLEEHNANLKKVSKSAKGTDTIR